MFKIGEPPLAKYIYKKKEKNIFTTDRDRVLLICIKGNKYTQRIGDK